MRTLAAVLVIVVATTVAGCTTEENKPAPVPLNARKLTDRTATDKAVSAAKAAERERQEHQRQKKQKADAKPLRDLTIALDPGHQLGNHNYSARINAPVPAGGFTKPCNTTGTATNGGVAEATINLELARAVARRLEALGARVRLTRTTNSERAWGPCVDARGRFGKQVGAKLMVSLHADGAPSSGYGFHVIAPARRAPWTSDIADRSMRLALSLRDALGHFGIPRSTYVGGGSGLDVRDDLGTLNESDVPVAMIEIGNMRNAVDAGRMTTRHGRALYARAVVRGIRAYLHR